MIRSTLPFALCILSTPAFAQDYKLGPDSRRQPGVPEGKVTRHSWTSKVFPGTVRDYWVYVPAQYQPSRPAAVMVFQDGQGVVGTDEKDLWRVPIVFDNLIHRGEMPVTVAIMVSPGVLPAPGDGQPARFNRSFEYDGLGEGYATFLLSEILPEVGKSVNLTSDPNLRAIAGSSSGGIAAFTAAWHRPNEFRRVMSFVGSYTDLRGGQVYPGLIRKTELKPLKIFLQDGYRDLNVYPGSWWLANLSMASALEYAGYDFQFVTGSEAHNSVHGSSILPDALRWLWRDWKEPIRARHGRTDVDRHYVSEILDAASGWEVMSSGHKFTEGPAVDKQGNVFFTDIPNNRIHKIAPDGKVSVFKEDTGAANGLMFGADGRLYACQNGRRRIVAYTMDGAESVIAEGVESNDIAVRATGEIYFTDPANGRVWFVNKAGEKRVVSEKEIERPNGVRLSPDQSMVIVADSRNKWVWSYQIQADGSLGNGQPFYRLETPDASSVSGADGMTMDTEGYLYVTTRLGIQICDAPGRVVGIINIPPGVSGVANAVFAGPDMQWLYVTARDKVFRRHTTRKGTLPWQPIAAPRPRL
jgi:sugar lactone lactonase YvrE/enterochelin esterase-like enzyme